MKSNGDLTNKRIVSKLEKAKQLTDSGSNIFIKERLVADERDILKETKNLGLTDRDIDEVLEFSAQKKEPPIAEALSKAIKEFENSMNDKKFLASFQFQLRSHLSQQNEIKRTEEIVQKYMERQIRILEKLETIQELHKMGTISESTPLSSKISLSDAFIKGALVSLAITNNILSANMEILEKHRRKVM